MEKVNKNRKAKIDKAAKQFCSDDYKKIKNKVGKNKQLKAKVKRRSMKVTKRARMKKTMHVIFIVMTFIQNQSKVVLMY